MDKKELRNKIRQLIDEQFEVNEILGFSAKEKEKNSLKLMLKMH
jgi:hypothetical protein